MSECKPFLVEALPYPYNALEPAINEVTLYYHHDKHYKAYVDNLNSALSEYCKFENYTVRQLILNSDQLPCGIRETVRFNAGGVYNHQLYFNSMAPPDSTVPHGTLLNAIQDQFGSLESMLDKMKLAGVTLKGSGWVYLLADSCGRLAIYTTCNQETPLFTGANPILTLDVWEHAYYLQYQNRRGDYIDAWFTVIDWDRAEELYLATVACIQ